MGTIKSNNFYVKDNAILLSYAKFALHIDILPTKDKVVYRMLVYQDFPTIALTYYFDSLEETLDFAENAIRPSYEVEEIVAKYTELTKEKEKIIRLIKKNN